MTADSHSTSVCVIGRPACGTCHTHSRCLNDIARLGGPNPQTVDAERLLAFFGSMGWIASLPGQDRRPLVERMRLRLTATSYVLPWEGPVDWARLVGDGSREPRVRHRTRPLIAQHP